MEKNKPLKTLIAYVPVLHEGYIRFFEKYVGAKELYILGEDLIEKFKPLTKDLRRIDSKLMVKAIDALNIFEKVSILDQTMLDTTLWSEKDIVMPKEDVAIELASEYFKDVKTFDPIFLRWDKHNALAEKPVVPEEQITRDEFHRRVMGEAISQGDNSSDIWRGVGAILVRDKKILKKTHNVHVPSQHTPYVFGDPRNNFHKGDHIEISTAIHAEARLIAESASEGIPLGGADLYVSVFPCPPCAKLIAFAGIKNLYCGGGYGILDGEEILKSKGVRIIFVE